MTLAPVKVEPGHVYLLGDNRNNSNDSRFMGQVAVEDVVGKVTGIWFSKERARIGTTFP
jgi:signal peptidase I